MITSVDEIEKQMLAKASTTADINAKAHMEKGVEESEMRESRTKHKEVEKDVSIFWKKF
ncbi:unnamed protein product, partial [Cuscuta europaea]